MFLFPFLRDRRWSGGDGTHSLRLERMLMSTWAWLRTAVWRMDSGPLAISQFSWMGGQVLFLRLEGMRKSDIRVVQSHTRYLVASGEKLASGSQIWAGGVVTGA